jgi:hypothetical protein
MNSPSASGQGGTGANTPGSTPGCR